MEAAAAATALKFMTGFAVATGAATVFFKEGKSVNELATGGGSALGIFGLKESEDAEPMDLEGAVGRELNAPDAKAPALSALYELDDDPKALAADSLKPAL